MAAARSRTSGGPSTGGVTAVGRATGAMTTPRAIWRGIGPGHPAKLAWWGSRPSARLEPSGGAEPRSGGPTRPASWGTGETRASRARGGEARSPRGQPREGCRMRRSLTQRQRLNRGHATRAGRSRRSTANRWDGRGDSRHGPRGREVGLRIGRRVVRRPTAAAPCGCEGEVEEPGEGPGRAPASARMRSMTSRSRWTATWPSRTASIGSAASREQARPLSNGRRQLAGRAVPLDVKTGGALLNLEP